jgi:iron complex outermembrane receptor protein
MLVKKRILYSHIMASLVAAIAAVGASPAALAQEAGPQAAAASSEVIIVTGTRTEGRSVQDSPVPVDVFSASDIATVAATDTNDILKALVPSFAINRQPISDGGTFTRPAELRGLPTDKTLVLVNSKRRHRAALVEIGGSGTQGPDIATIPASALKTVEVLRDGAAAQYGSDAIAGVINFILKDADDGFSVTGQAGQYYEGDGTEYVIGANAGFSLFGNGFVNVSGEYSKADATVRAEQYCESWFCLDPSNPDYDPTASYNTYLNDPDFMAAVDSMGDVVQPWGQPNSEAYRAFVNAGYTISDTMELYAFGNYSHSEADGSFYYRYPFNGTIEQLREADGSIYWPLDIYPGGFTPRFFGEIIDYSAVGGLKGEILGFNYDVSARYGRNEVQYTLKNTINPSLGPDTPRSFRPGDLINEETQFQADFVKPIEVGAASPLSVGFGVSYLDESYEIVGGEEASYIAGPYATPDPWNLCTDAGAPTVAGAAVITAGSTLNCANPDDPVYQVVGVGSNGFPGYSPQFAGTYERDSAGAYVDLSIDVTDKLFLQAAARYEDYSDFGSELVWKAAGRYEFVPGFAMRGSIGTGFRAPTPGQQGTTNVSTRLPEGLPVATGLFPAGGAIAQALGAEELRPEKSTNYTLGATGAFAGFNITIDAYQIEIEDRMRATTEQGVSTDPADAAEYANYQALVAAGVPGAETIGAVFFFQNAYDTTTTGVDLVVTKEVDWSPAIGSTSFMGSLNYNKTELDELKIPGLLDAEAVFDLENGPPEWRSVLSATHEIGPFSVMGRANIFGPYKNAEGDPGPGTIQEFDTEVLFDLELGWNVTDTTLIAVGARNIFDEYPDIDRLREECCGALYRSDSVVDWQGGFYYVRARHAF